MPDYSFIANPQTSSGLQSLSSIMNTANTAQSLQMNRLNIQQKQETLPADIARAKAESATSQTQTKEAAFQLESKYTGTALNEAAALYKDPAIVNSDPNGTVNALRDARERMISRGVPADKAEWVTSQLISKAHQPGAVYQSLQNIIQANAGPATQAGVVNAPLSMVTTPQGAMAPMQLQQGAPGAVAPVPISSLQGSGVIPAGIPPSGLQAPATDVLEQPIIAEKNQQGTITYKAPPNSNYRPVMQFPQGESKQTIPEVQAIRTQANTLGQAAPGQHFNNKMILDLTSDAFTGTGAGKIANVLNAIGIKNLAPNSATDPAVAQSQLKHFISLAIQDNAKAQGANTDAARSIAEQAVLPTDSPEKAIKNITKVNDAYVTGNELYNKGMEAAINSQSNQSGVFAARQFRNAWAQSFDPRITLLENAQTSGDTETINRILGPKGSPQRAQAQKVLLPKAQALRALSQGQM